MEKEKIVVTGANGQLGQELRAASGAFPQFDFIFLGRQDLPIQNPEKISAILEGLRPAWCINCAAYTAVDKAETEKEQAYAVNGDAVGMLAEACRRSGARLVHISTDYVFDGASAVPLKEDDPTAPLNVYGASKLKGEQLALQENPGTLIIRTSWVYSVFGANFVKTMIRLMREKPSINVIDDQVGSPTYAADLAGAILRIVAGNKFIPGIYHYSNEGQTSWFGFAVAIKELIGSPCAIHPIVTTQYPTPAKRPRYSLLNKDLIKETYGLSIPEWRTSLAACLARFSPSV